MNLFKEPAKKLLSLGLMTGPRTRVIFMHHDISEPDAPQHSELYSTTPARYREQMEYIGENFELVPLEQLFGERFGGPGKPLAAVTFDDGFRSVRETAMPYLVSRGIPFAVFVNGGAVLENKLHYTEEYTDLNRRYDKRVYCGEEDVLALDRAGALIGNHCLSHRPLSGCDPQTLQREIVDNRKFLEKLLGKPVYHLALPYGKRSHYDEAALKVCRDSGHRFVYSNNPTTFKSGQIHPLHDLIPRIGLTSQDDAFLRFIINRATFKKIDL
jgi:peptidoglycan/xylan/chitin deacetylase (PgdA/CDA1 family)